MTSGRLEIGKMSVTLDDEGCAYVAFGPVRIPEGRRAATRSEVVAPGIVIDYDADGAMLGIEVVGFREPKEGGGAGG